MIWSNSISDPTLLVNHYKFLILEWSNQTVALVTAGHQETSSWQGRHRAWALRIWQLAIFNNYILPILIPSCSVSWIHNFYLLPALNPTPPIHAAAQLCPRCQGAPPWSKWWLTKVFPIREKAPWALAGVAGVHEERQSQPDFTVIQASRAARSIHPDLHSF